jgi:malate/lactate dehydrogenase
MVKAVVIGAAGGIGQPLSLLLKLNPAVTELALYDVVNSPGVAVDLSHIPTPAKVAGYLPPDDGLEKALTGAHVVVIPAGVPRKPGMTRDDLFKVVVASRFFSGMIASLKSRDSRVVFSSNTYAYPAVCVDQRRHRARHREGDRRTCT